MPPFWKIIFNFTMQNKESDLNRVWINSKIKTAMAKIQNRRSPSSRFQQNNENDENQLK